MRIILSYQVYKDINKLYNYKVYLTDKEFCQSFISYAHKIAQDFKLLMSGRVSFTIKGRLRHSRLSSIDVSYNLFGGNVIIIHSIGFIGIPHLYRMCAYERKQLRITRSKRPLHIKASVNPSDYIRTNIRGGAIGGIEVEVVQRKNATTRSNKKVFNYLYNGRI